MEFIINYPFACISSTSSQHLRVVMLNTVS